MARQLAVRTVVAWFSSQSLEQQREAISQLEQAHEQSRAAKRTELLRQLAELGYVRKRRGRSRPSANGSANGAKPSQERAPKIKVKAKYRDPKTNETWSGRGRMAGWLKAKKDAGERIEKYLV